MSDFHLPTQDFPHADTLGEPRNISHTDDPLAPFVGLLWGATLSALMVAGAYLLLVAVIL